MTIPELLLKHNPKFKYDPIQHKWIVDAILEYHRIRSINDLTEKALKQQNKK